MEKLQTFIDLGLVLTKKDEQRIVCPNCIARGVSNPKDKCLAVNVSKMVYACHKCGDLYKGVIEDPNFVKETPFQPLSIPDSYDLSKKGLEFFKSRSISLNTLKRFKVTSDDRSINFNFFKNDELINVKKRFPNKKFTLEKGGLITFYNYDAINSEQILITEGEIDALSVYEALPNVPVLSLPNGANSLKFLDDEIDNLEDVEEIIIATDGDEQGRKAKDNLIARFGHHRTSFVVYPDGCKDMNEVLVKFGIEGVKQCYNERRMLPIKAVNTANDYASTVTDYIVNGFPDGLHTGVPEIDRKIKLMLSEFVIITGTPNSGKSTVIDYLASLHANHVKNNIRICVLSAENSIPIHIIKIACHFLKRDVTAFRSMSDDVSQIITFINDNYVFINTPDMDKMNYRDIVSKMKEVVKRYGCNYFIIDPYNYVERDGIDHSSHAPALRAFANFAKNYFALTMLVAHPRKMNKMEDGNYEYVTPYDIAGTADFYNIADTVLSIWRDFSSTQNLILVQKVRNEWLGKAPSEIGLRYTNKTYEAESII